jgi:hypothetical protein
MVAVGANVIETYRRITADVCSLNATSGISGPYYEEVEVRRVLLGCADRIRRGILQRQWNTKNHGGAGSARFGVWARKRD